MTSTTYKAGVQYSYTKLMQSAYAATETEAEAEALAKRVVAYARDLLPEKLLWYPHASELILEDVDNPMTDAEEEDFDFDAILCAAFDRAQAETAGNG